VILTNCLQTFFADWERLSKGLNLRKAAVDSKADVIKEGILTLFPSDNEIPLITY